MAQCMFNKAYLFAAISVVGIQSSAFAIGPLDAYREALKNDPQFRAAKAERESGKQFEVIGRSGLLPQVQYSFSKSRNLGESVSPDITGKLKSTDLDYPSSSKSINLRQPLFNLESYARFEQGRAQTSYSEAQFDAKASELMVRVLTAYADARFADDQLKLYEAQRDMYREQIKVNNRLYEKGEGTKTDLIETQAKLDVAEALCLEARDNLLNAKNILSSIVGSDILQLDALRAEFNTSHMIQGEFEFWREAMERNNPEIQAARYAIEIAEKEISKSRSGHVPRIDLNASYNHGKSETINTQKQDNNIRTIGVQLVIPIYSGGYVNAISKQSVSQKEKAVADFDNVHGRVTSELRKQYNAVNTGIVKLAALQKSVASGEALVEATSQSIKGGIRINLDLLNAQQQLVTAKRDLAQARYNFLVSFLKLKTISGTATMNDMQLIAAFFAPE